ncbi:MAG TPA: Yip1 family protein [Caulobacteraceae bacterium]|jgi:hypothetical protein
MTVEVPGGPKTASLIERVKNILLKPNAEWDRIEAEPASVQSLFMGYAIILAAIGPICQLIGSVVFGHCIFFACYRPPIISAVVGAVVSYALALVGVFAFGFIIEALAPSFDAQKNRVQAMKVAVYSSTAAWLAGVFYIIPQLGALAIVGLYSLYLLFVGLPKLMKAPKEKGTTYTIVAIVCAIVMWIVIGVVGGAVAGMGMVGGAMMGPHYGDNGTVSGTVHIGNSSLDLGKLQQVTNQIKAQAAAQQAAANGSAPPAGTATVTPVGADVLRNMLPGSINGMARGDISSSSGSAMGIAASEASATYTNGNAHLTLKVSDTGTASGMMGLAGALNVNSDEQNGSHYKKVSTVNGNMTTEEYDNASHNGSYMTIVAGRFAVEADGTGVDMNTMKAAVNAVPQGQLASMKNH